MKHWIVFGIVSLGTFALCQFQARSELKEVTFERTRCFGACPAYKVTLRANGTLTYVGQAFVPRVGTYTAKFWGNDLEKLSQLARRNGIWHLKDKYSLQITDQASQKLTLKGAGTKTIDEYGHSGPVELWGFQMAIDGILENARDWKKVK